MVYFPQLLQGPILLRSEFMGQLKEPERRRFHAERFSEGIQFFVFGLAKKVLLADTLAKAVNYGYSNVSMLDSISALLLAVGYLTELYFDFSGYCDMAVGLGKMIGLEVAENFDAPFHSASVKEFWRRWHMTLGRFLQGMYTSPGRKSEGEDADAMQCDDRYVAFRALARRGVDLCAVGIFTWSRDDLG